MEFKQLQPQKKLKNRIATWSSYIIQMSKEVLNLTQLNLEMLWRLTVFCLFESPESIMTYFEEKTLTYIKKYQKHNLQKKQEEI